MITALVQEPDKDLSDIIKRIMGKPADKAPPAQPTVADFAIGTFSVPNANNQQAQKTATKSGRQTSSATATSNGRLAGGSGSSMGGGGGGGGGAHQRLAEPERGARGTIVAAPLPPEA